MEEENSFLDQKKRTEDYKSFLQNKIELENQRKFELKKNGTSNET